MGYDDWLSREPDPGQFEDRPEDLICERHGQPLQYVGGWPAGCEMCAEDQEPRGFEEAISLKESA